MSDEALPEGQYNIEEVRVLRRTVQRVNNYNRELEEQFDKYAALADQLSEENGELNRKIEELTETNQTLADTIASIQQGESGTRTPA